MFLVTSESRNIPASIKGQPKAEMGVITWSVQSETILNILTKIHKSSLTSANPSKNSKTSNHNFMY